MAALKKQRRDSRTNMTEAVFLRISPSAKARLDEITTNLRIGASAIIDQVINERSAEFLAMAIGALTERVRPLGPSADATERVRAAKLARELAPRKRPNQGKGKRRA
jgi:hypothetical protein